MGGPNMLARGFEPKINHLANPLTLRVVFLNLLKFW